MLVEVGVFEHPGKRVTRLDAYTMWFSPLWPGCCLHRVNVERRSQAKKAAMAEHRNKCVVNSSERA